MLLLPSLPLQSSSPPSLSTWRSSGGTRRFLRLLVLIATVVSSVAHAQLRKSHPVELTIKSGSIRGEYMVSERASESASVSSIRNFCVFRQSAPTILPSSKVGERWSNRNFYETPNFRHPIRGATSRLASISGLQTLNKQNALSGVARRAMLTTAAFQKPEEPASWRGVMNATQYPPMCAQFPRTRPTDPEHLYKIHISEDCLYLK